MEKKGTLEKLKEKERETRRRIIIDAARKVFERKTYDSVSMAEIARAAGMAKSSIYTYFSNQEALYVEIAFIDSGNFIKSLKEKMEEGSSNPVRSVIDHFLEYYFQNIAQWRMITHFALHGKADNNSIEKLNEISRRLMDIFDSAFRKTGYSGDPRLLSHTLFSALSGILIAFRNYPGRTEEERMAHIKRIGIKVEEMVSAWMSCR